MNEAGTEQGQPKLHQKVMFTTEQSCSCRGREIGKAESFSSLFINWSKSWNIIFSCFWETEVLCASVPRCPQPWERSRPESPFAALCQVGSRGTPALPTMALCSSLGPGPLLLDGRPTGVHPSDCVYWHQLQSVFLMRESSDFHRCLKQEFLFWHISW